MKEMSLDSLRVKASKVCCFGKCGNTKTCCKMGAIGASVIILSVVFLLLGFAFVSSFLFIPWSSTYSNVNGTWKAVLMGTTGVLFIALGVLGVTGIVADSMRVYMASFIYTWVVILFEIGCTICDWVILALDLSYTSAALWIYVLFFEFILLLCLSLMADLFLSLANIVAEGGRAMANPNKSEPVDAATAAGGGDTTSPSSSGDLGGHVQHEQPPPPGYDEHV
eukprot:Selendium_serpulae@DN2895_c0_g1_i1.p1